MLTLGTILQNRYQIIRQLGVGGMGAAYLANDLRLGNRLVVVKENVGGDPQQFQIEANILATLNHPNLPRVSDHFVETATVTQPTDVQYLVMDYVEGQNLDSLLQQRGALSESAALALMRHVLDAVQYLHANRIIHRDIKPQNIIVTPQGKAVLVDFGIAKRMVTGRPTQTGARAATPGFAAPEQYGGGTDQRSDVYSLAATLYTLLIAQVPPEAPLLASGAATLKPPRALNSAISAPVEQVILRGMTMQAAQRFQNVAEMRRMLFGATIATATATLQTGLETSQTTAPHARSIGLPPAASLAIVFGGLLLLGVSGLGFLLLQTPVQRETPTPTIRVAMSTSTRVGTALPTQTRVAVADAPTRPPIPTLTLTRAPTSTATPRLPTLTPTRPLPTGRIAFRSTRDGNREVYVMNADGTSQQRLTYNAGGEDSDPAWSPDGRVITYMSQRSGNWEIYVMNPDGSSQRNLTSHPKGDWYPTWSPDGRSITFYSDRDGSWQIYVMSADGSNQRRLTDSAGDNWFPAWSPDGRYIAFSSTRDGNAEIYVMNVDGSNQRRLTRSAGDNERPTWSPDSRSIAFASDRGGNWQVYTMNSDGTNLQNLTNSSSDDVDPVWSPDGHFMAFVSDRDGNKEIYVMSADGTDQRRLTRSSGDDDSPAWSH